MINLKKIIVKGKQQNQHLLQVGFIISDAASSTI
jgi:hypothetical protein